MLEYLKSEQCIDCGYNDHPAALQFDHIRDVKTAAISVMMVNGCSWKTILIEIKKCEIRCANCHSIRTAEEFGYYTKREL